MTKLEELHNAKSCLSRAGDHEMTFVLLARDITSPATIRFWVNERISQGKNNASDDQILEALHCANFMEQQQRDRIGLGTGRSVHWLTRNDLERLKRGLAGKLQKPYWSWGWIVRWLVPLAIVLWMSKRLMGNHHVWYQDEEINLETIPRGKMK